MKIKYIFLICSLFLSIQIYSQANFHYQATLRNVDGSFISNKNVKVRFSLLDSTNGDQVVYTELHEIITSPYGGINLSIGSGESELGVFNSIDWSEGTYSIKTEIDAGGGLKLTGNQALQTTPYSIYADVAGGVQKKSTDGTLWNLNVSNDGVLSAMKAVEKIIPIPSGYSKLVFNDEFDGDGLVDEDKWSYEEGYVRNGEKQYYTVKRLENAYQKDGFLHIVALNDSAVINGEKRAVTSASLHTRNKHAWKYCRVEMRAKLPKSLGTWPALWMMPQDDVYGWWPNSGEIDIMEHVGYDPNKIHFAIHSQKYNSTMNNHKNYSIYAPTSYTEFHTYGIEWHEDRIDWYYDGVRRFTVKDTESTWMAWPFNNPFYLIVNLAFGGGWGGREGIDLSSLPQTYIIDYIRVYQ